MYHHRRYNAYHVCGSWLILAQSAMAFNFVKYAGAAYLIYLGITKVFLFDGLILQKVNAPLISIRKTYTSAVLTNTLNPKVAIFF